MSPPLYLGPWLDPLLMAVLLVAEVYAFVWLDRRIRSGKMYPDPFSVMGLFALLSVFLILQRAAIPYAVATYNATVNVTSGTVNATVSEYAYRYNRMSTIYAVNLVAAIVFLLYLGITYIIEMIYRTGRRAEVME